MKASLLTLRSSKSKEQVVSDSARRGVGQTNVLKSDHGSLSYRKLSVNPAK